MKTPEQRTLDIVTQVSMLVHGPHMLNHLFICLLIVPRVANHGFDRDHKLPKV